MVAARPRHQPVIAIDGGTSTGKTSTAKRVAQRLELPHISTGLMYRTLAWMVLTANLDVDDATICFKMAEALTAYEFEFLSGETVNLGGIRLDSSELRHPAVADGSSRVAVHAEVRQILLDLQRKAAAGGAVVEGRDIGTVVFPKADLKVFLTVSEPERLRRATQTEGEAIALANAERDRRESTRAVAPMRAARDAWVLDTTHLKVSEVVELIVFMARMRQTA